MILRVRFWGYLLLLGTIGFFSFRTYNYFFDTSFAHLSLSGLDGRASYAGDIQCAVASSKAGTVSVRLDDQVFVTQCAIAADEQGHQFTIPTATLSNGAHCLKVLVHDKTFNKNKAELAHSFQVDNVPLQAALLKSEEEFKVLQGRTLHVQLQVNKHIKNAKIAVFSQTYDCFPESKNSTIYEAFIPISCEENPKEYLFSIDVVDKVGNTARLDNKFEVLACVFKKSTMQVSNEKMIDEKELGIDTKRFEEILLKCADESLPEKLWKGSFCTPIEVQRVSTEFGTIRTTQHKGLYAHKGIDVINLPKSVVWSPQGGKVIVKDRFVDYGNTVIIDHGLGIITLLCHLDSFADIEEGQTIEKGNPVGTIGKTGYANGYHLHWEMRINNIAIDPMQWTTPLF